ncbi:hypothetical protein CHLNCDRAFT_144558 [Chlorella variabilis]|uniref:Peptidase S1 domain-containing protein n=1 Tax=Chlorella variabilis TaxID=554065 RepID=E1ZBP3_CHLVA|nr:hypothetical protein CHLNCDRAFT_144558 [Chlorella variabilis]EFN56679.1 hypothetical protein CHLNCDRAFT_144558 [Chlorella variabilis]|eukprot:XP_005848781.1 hypothetical protein CHLNCDRAFT_144558 [Chlorella variabilis]
MQPALLLLLLAAAFSVASAALDRRLLDDGVQSAISNGRNAPRNRYKYFASMREAANPEDPSCGASLIHESVVLTAAHVRIGAYAFNATATPDTGYQERRVAKIVRHPDYVFQRWTLNKKNNDVALLYLSRPSTYPPIKLAPYKAKAEWSNPVPDWTPVTLIGLGYTVFEKKFPKVLQEVGY